MYISFFVMIISIIFVFYNVWKLWNYDLSKPIRPEDVKFYKWSHAKEFGLNISEWKHDRYAFKQWYDSGREIPYEEWKQQQSPDKLAWWRKHKNIEVCPGYPGELPSKPGVKYKPKRNWHKRIIR